jgi:molybdopterin converting factor small subunit
MARVTVALPRLLEPAVGPTRRVELEAESVGEAIRLLLERHPTLRVHLFDEQGQLRQHVLCFVAGSQTRLVDRSTPIAEPTQITFLQAVSGGAPG